MVEDTVIAVAVLSGWVLMVLLYAKRRLDRTLGPRIEQAVDEAFSEAYEELR